MKKRQDYLCRLNSDSFVKICDSRNAIILASMFDGIQHLRVFDRGLLTAQIDKDEVLQIYIRLFNSTVGPWLISTFVHIGLTGYSADCLVTQIFKSKP
ncbi:hypothetical protein AVEN_187130-1 [Araneus ventricosus]|uniref:Uncharacterized protein n=1 Tax=Araneus ventricosus TaxID=182803 RepID=A0A4Y2JAK8_ARAVE|nr:hypothetical protein AVEN_90204-1 [Araneus ventricosus]GBM87002.1 hypothetical protein AVEN_90701-1 [Araneus ventricosus]GBM87057.1 hypothetical protein AVEN_167988-1 [Araneus ventricosus]GBM87080.1 hypothetical protein AVEN_187130-1 [Araneus ventricosus]